MLACPRTPAARTLAKPRWSPPGGCAPPTQVNGGSGYDGQEQAEPADRFPGPGLRDHRPQRPSAPRSHPQVEDLSPLWPPPPPRPDRGAAAPEEQAGHQCPPPASLPAYRPGPDSSQGRPTSRDDTARHQNSPRPQRCKDST